MSVVIEHLILGKKKYTVKVDKETDCKKCIHKHVCKVAYEDFCKNYEFGTSEYSGCGGCQHRHTRWDGEYSIPCFRCIYFKKIKTRRKK